VRLPHAGEQTFTAPLADDLVAHLQRLGTPASSTPLFAAVS
jgi:hypothetical protein